MCKSTSQQSWQFLTEDVEGILEGLRQGEFDHIYAANPTLFDRFLAYLGEAGVRETLDQFPDPRQRRSIPVRFLTQTLLVRPLFAVSSLAQLGPVLSTNAAVLRLLGFNAQQIEHGFRANAQRRPFDEETLADFAARIDPHHCLQHTKAVLKKLIVFHPEVFARATLLMDCKAVYAPAGKVSRLGGQLAAVALKVCVLSLWLEGEALPIAWLFGGEHEADQVLGKALLDEVLPALVEAGAQELVMDAGFLNGEWLRELHQRHGLAILLRVRENMELFADALGQTRGRPVLPGETPPHWTQAPLPKIKKGRKPRARRVMLCRQLESWQSLGMPADALVVEDRFADGEIRHFVVACIGAKETDPLRPLARWRARWAIEELFMVADRYQGLGRLFPCREGFARSWVHFAFLAYSLLFLFDLWAKDNPGELAETRELLVIRGGNYGLIGLGDFAIILLDYHDAWQSKRSQIMAKLNFRRPP
jgi:hypothetical protein